MSRARDLGSSINSTAAGKNLLINGGFDFWQRLSAPGTPAQYNANNGYPYSADRWAPMQYQSCRASRVLNTYSTPGPISQYVMQISSISSTDLANGARMQIQQKIESLNTYPLRGKYATLSFWIKFNDSTFTSTNNVAGGGSGAYGNFSASINAFTSTTDAYTGSTGIDSGVATINIINGSLPTVWTKYTTSGLVPLNTNNLNVLFGFATLGSTTTNDFYNYQISDVQLEQGSSATTFSRAGGTIQGELALCQRYYWRSGFPNESIDYAKHALGYSQNTTSLWCQMLHPVTMRVAPSIESSTLAVSGSTIGIYDSISNFNVSSLSIDRSTIRSCNFNANTTGLTAYRSAQLQNLNNTNGFIGFAAEL